MSRNVTLKEAFDFVRFCVVYGIFEDEYDEMARVIKDAGFDIGKEYGEKVLARNSNIEETPVRFIDRIELFTVYHDGQEVYKTHNRSEAEFYWDSIKEPGIHTCIKSSKGFWIIDTEDLPF